MKDSDMKNIKMLLEELCIEFITEEREAMRAEANKNIHKRPKERRCSLIRMKTVTKI